MSKGIDPQAAQLFLRVERENARIPDITLQEFPTLWRKLKQDTDSYPFPRTREQDIELHSKNYRFAAKYKYFYYQTVNYKITSEYIEDMVDLKCNKMPVTSREEVMRLAAEINARHGVTPAAGGKPVKK